MDAAGVELCRKLEEKVAFIALNKKTKYLKILVLENQNKYFHLMDLKTLKN